MPSKWLTWTPKSARSADSEPLKRAKVLRTRLLGLSLGGSLAPAYSGRNDSLLMVLRARGYTYSRN